MPTTTFVDTETTQGVREKIAENTMEYCMSWIAGPELEGKDRAALVKKNRWAPGSKITISFLDGDPSVQDRVRQAALGWLQPGLARLSFDFRKDDPNALVRISFKYSGSWSTIGTSCKQVPKGQPSMNYGWLTPDSEDEEVQRVVLHEFGHMLGLIHEHQNPAGGIRWNKEQVYKDLSGPPNNWTKDVIDHNIFEPYSRRETNYTATDVGSIMMYPIPKTWTLDGTSAALNTELSPTDRQFIHKQYP